MANFCMPSLGADMDAATLMEWKIKPGDVVKRGDIVAVVETQKGVIDIEIFEAGIVECLVVDEGTEVPVGTVLAMIRGQGEAISEIPPVQTNASPVPETHAFSEIPPTRARISPAARRRARELGVSLDNIVSTEPIRLEDIEKMEAKPKPKSPSGDAMRTAIAAAMSRSKREIPHYYLGHTIDMEPAMKWLAEYNAGRPIAERMVYAVLLVKAVALALKKVKELNGYWRDGHFEPSGDIHVGVAISLRTGGLVAPALCHVDQKGLDILMPEFHDLVNRARSGQLRASEMSNGTITVTSLGEQGVESVYPVIYPPQVAMVGFGSMVERPWAIDGLLGVRRVITASLAGDHRVSDGHRGALFLSHIEKFLQKPGEL